MEGQQPFGLGLLQRGQRTHYDGSRPEQGDNRTPHQRQFTGRQQVQEHAHRAIDAQLGDDARHRRRGDGGSGGVGHRNPESERQDARFGAEAHQKQRQDNVGEHRLGSGKRPQSIA